MSYQIGIDTIHLRPTPRLAHTEYNDHTRLAEWVESSAGQPFNEAWNLDLLWCTDDGPIPWELRGRTTDMGHAEFMEGGVDRRQPKPSPFTEIEQVLSFDAVEEYGLPEFTDLVDYYQALYDNNREANPNQVNPGGYYKTIVSGAIETFGWDALLLGASDAQAFTSVLDSFFRLTMHHVRAWAETSIEVFICHDDMVWSGGPFIRPSFYRSVIFPRYQRLWSVLKSAGKKVLFCSDGDYSMFLDDIAVAGADGFIFEPMVPLELVVKKYGKTHAILGSAVDCRTLTYDSKDKIRQEVETTLRLAKECPGFMAAVGNHLPANIPLENALFYYECLSENWKR
jgi:hypothetical protein